MRKTILIIILSFLSCSIEKQEEVKIFNLLKILDLSSIKVKDFRFSYDEAYLYVLLDELLYSIDCKTKTLLSERNLADENYEITRLIAGNLGIGIYQYSIKAKEGRISIFDKKLSIVQSLKLDQNNDYKYQENETWYVNYYWEKDLIRIIDYAGMAKEFTNRKLRLNYEDRGVLDVKNGNLFQIKFTRDFSCKMFDQEDSLVLDTEKLNIKTQLGYPNFLYDNNFYFRGDSIKHFKYNLISKELCEVTNTPLAYQATINGYGLMDGTNYYSRMEGTKILLKSRINIDCR